MVCLLDRNYLFFDGLASALLTGRALRPISDQTGVSRAKLAYIVDSTGSAVACVAIMSTWIAYQLSMIREGYLVAGIEGTEPFLLFIFSIPRNFYCWFTLLLVFFIHTLLHESGSDEERGTKGRQRNRDIPPT